MTGSWPRTTAVSSLPARQRHAPSLEPAETIDCGGRWITPGLVDCHTHLVYGGNRAHEFELRLAGASYEEIARAGGGIVSTMRATRAATEDALVAGALPRVDALIGRRCHHDGDQVGLRARPRQRTEVAAGGPPHRRGAVVVGDDDLPRCARAAARSKRRQGCLYRRGLRRDAAGRRAPGWPMRSTAFCEGIAFTPQQIERCSRRRRRGGCRVKLHAEQLSNLHGRERSRRATARCRPTIWSMSTSRV
jgi:imidazolonepropionase